MLPEQQQRIMGYFIEEAKDHLNTIEQGLLNLQSTLEDSEMVNEVFRAAHSVKGGAAMLGINSVQKTAHRLEDYFKILKEYPAVKIDQTLESLLLRVFDALQELLEQLQGPFGLTEDKADAVMAEISPVFDSLNAHLNQLVNQAGGQITADEDTPVSTPVAAVAAPPQPARQEESALQLIFQSDVPGYLREMLQLFKQADQVESRQQLQEVCRSLARAGEQFELQPWCNLIATARQAIANPDNTYRTLAPLIIKEIKQAQELVLSGRSAEIVATGQLEALLPPMPVVEPDIAADLGDLLAIADQPEAELVGLDAPTLETTDGIDAVDSVFAVFDQDNNGEAAIPEFSFDTFDEEPSDNSSTTDFPFSFDEEPIAAQLPETGLPPIPAVEDKASSRTGPEVGMAELNSLADLFESEAPDLDVVWQEEEIIADSSEDFLNSLDFDQSNDFSDLLFDGGTNTPQASADDDLNSLFGSALLDDDSSEPAGNPDQFTDFADFLTESDPSLANDDLFGLDTTDAPALNTVDQSTAIDDFNDLFSDAPADQAPQIPLESSEDNFLDLADSLDVSESATNTASNDLNALFAGLDETDLDFAELPGSSEDSSSVGLTEDSTDLGDLFDDVSSEPLAPENVQVEEPSSIDLELESDLWDSVGDLSTTDSAVIESDPLTDDELLDFGADFDLTDTSSPEAVETTEDLKAPDFDLWASPSQPEMAASTPAATEDDVLDLFAKTPEVESSLDAVETDDFFGDSAPTLEDIPELADDTGAFDFDDLFESASTDEQEISGTLDLEELVSDDASLAPAPASEPDLTTDLWNDTEGSDSTSTQIESFPDLFSVEASSTEKSDASNELDVNPEDVLEDLAAPEFDLLEINLDSEDSTDLGLDLIVDEALPVEDLNLLDSTDLGLDLAEADDSHDALEDPGDFEFDLFEADDNAASLDFEVFETSSNELLFEEPDAALSATPESEALADLLLEADSLVDQTSDDELNALLDATDSEASVLDGDELDLFLVEETVVEVTVNDLEEGGELDLSVTSTVVEMTVDAFDDEAELADLNEDILATEATDLFDLEASTEAELAEVTEDDLTDNLFDLDTFEPSTEALDGSGETEATDLFDLEASTEAELAEVTEDDLTDNLFDLDTFEPSTEALDGFGETEATDLFDLETSTEAELVEVAEDDLADDLFDVDTFDPNTEALDGSVDEDILGFLDPELDTSEETRLTFDEFNFEEAVTSEAVADGFSDNLADLFATDTEDSDSPIGETDSATTDLDFSALDADSDLDFLLETEVTSSEPDWQTSSVVETWADDLALEESFEDSVTAVPESLVNLEALATDEVEIDEFAGLEALLEDASELSQVAPVTPATPATDADLDDFADLEALLEDDSELSQVAPATSAIHATGADLDDFADLEALLDTEPPAPPMPSTRASAPKVAEVDDEFDDLEKLLEAADKTMGGPPTVTTSRRQAPTLSRRPRGLAEQTMRVSVKHLDGLSNLVGELVVNRNSLEQDQERLRQFLDNLLYQVQQLSDVGQRMRDLYERSLLEDALLSSRMGNRSFFDSGNSTPAEHPTGVLWERIEMDRFTPFHSLSQEMIELIVRVRESSSDIEFIVDEMDQVTRMFRQVTTQLQEGLTRSRMVPFAQTADRLPRAVRDIAIKCGKQAELQIEGRETLIDKMILEQLYDPMTHLVNNAITHGIETPEIRKAAGKPPVGRINIQAFHQGNQTILSVSDDGAGIDVERVKQKAVEKGLITPSEARTMSNLDVYDLLFHPGFSTKDQADDFAGRGVGMDVVRTSLSEIRGVINTDSTLGKGTTFTIRLPLTLSISKALCCISHRARIAFPMDGVEDMLDVPRERIQTNEEGQTCIMWRDSLLPFRPLSELLKYNRQLGRGSVYGGNQEDDIVSIVVLRSAGNFLALQVDQVLGEQEIVIKQLEGPVPKPIGVAGATVLGDGRIMPIADVLELIDLAMGRARREVGGTLWDQREDQTPPEAPVVKTDPTVLIVDDSITVRELLSMTFNKVGYRVVQARDGQEAWEQLRSGLPCDIVFCDIEMPRMDGLELLSRIQKDSSLSHLPIAMLTSRGADRHRQMAAQLGAKGYFTKPYLEEALLEAAQRMLKGETLIVTKAQA